MLMKCIMCDNIWDDDVNRTRCPECGLFGAPYQWPVGSAVRSVVPFEQNGSRYMYRGVVNRSYRDGHVVVMLSAASQDKIDAKSIVVPNNHIIPEGA